MKTAIYGFVLLLLMISTIFFNNSAAKPIEIGFALSDLY